MTIFSYDPSLFDNPEKPGALISVKQTSSICGRFMPAPSILVGASLNFYVFARMRYADPAYTAEAEQTLNTAMSLISRVFTGVYLNLDDSLVPQLADRSLFGGDAVDATRDIAESALEADGYFDSFNTFPPPMSARTGTIILPGTTPPTLQAVFNFFRDRITKSIDVVSDASSSFPPAQIKFDHIELESNSALSSLGGVTP